MKEPKSKRWVSALSEVQDKAGDLVAALQELESIQDEYQEQFDDLAEHGDDPSLAEKLEKMLEIDVTDIISAVEEVENLPSDPPKRFSGD